MKFKVTGIEISRMSDEQVRVTLTRCDEGKGDAYLYDEPSRANDYKLGDIFVFMRKPVDPVQ